MTTVLVVDDQQLVRAGLRTLLETDPSLRVVGEAADGEGAVREAARLSPDVVVMDVRMPGTDGIEATRRLRARRLDGLPRVLVLTTFDVDEHVWGALRAGADGFLLKTASTAALHEAVHAVAAGSAVVAPGPTRRLLEAVTAAQPRPPLPPAYASLTPRERDVLLLVARGCPNREVAARLHLAETTVKTHVTSLLDRLGLGNRVQLAAFAWEHGLVGPGDR